jgi:hypothetical protein
MAKDFYTIPCNVVNVPDTSGGQAQVFLQIQIPPGEGNQQEGYITVQVAAANLGTIAAGAATLHLLQ